MTSAIHGYRELTEAEVDLINEVKAAGVRLGKLVSKLKDKTPGLDQRWIAIGATDLQKGLMGLSRGIAQPTTF